MATGYDWKSFEGIAPESDHARRISDVLEHVDFAYLCTTTLQLRSILLSPSRVTRSLTCNIDTTKFTSGYYNVVLELTYSDNISWIVRIRPPNINNQDDKEAETAMLSEVTTMKYIRSNTTILISNIFDFDISAKNSFGYIYILMEALPGRSLSTGFSRAVPRDKQPQIASQFAGYLHQLSSLRFPSTGRLLPDSSSPSGVKLVPTQNKNAGRKSGKQDSANVSGINGQGSWMRNVQEGLSREDHDGKSDLKSRRRVRCKN